MVQIELENQKSYHIVGKPRQMFSQFVLKTGKHRKKK